MIALHLPACLKTACAATQQAGAVVIGLIALDLIATTVTLAIGATWLHR